MGLVQSDKKHVDKHDKHDKHDKQHLKICFVGDQKAGKTALIHQLLHEEFLSTYDHTLEDLFNYTINFHGENIQLHIFDTPGGDDRTSIRELYLSNSRAFVIVYAIDDRDSFKSLGDICAEIRKARKNKEYAIVLCANKTDLGEDANVIKKEEEDLLEKTSGFPILRTSSKDRDSVVAVFRKLMEIVVLQEV